MLYNILAAQEAVKEVGISTAALYAAIGFLVVFLGISFLIFVIWIVGKIILKINGKAKSKKGMEAKDVVVVPIPKHIENNEISEETVAVITAALMAYYQKNNPKCEFMVKRIKRI